MTNTPTNTPTSKCCEKPVFCRCIEHGGKCRNCGKDRWKEPTPTTDSKNSSEDWEKDIRREIIAIMEAPMRSRFSTADIRVGHLSSTALEEKVKDLTELIQHIAKEEYERGRLDELELLAMHMGKQLDPLVRNVSVDSLWGYVDARQAALETPS